ncbi:MAG: N-acetylneuraminate synthase family protein [Candidatus Staskawiczbacteria bacterium]|nr:N-acetylneuraminate synthase family protein [Candidatus Staskawiczbacteria bacterium]
MKNINQRPLFVFEMANNHQGNVEHGLRIIREIYEISKNFPYNFSFKLQARDIPTFIHPDYQNRTDLKYVKRFSETKLAEEQFKILKDEIDKLGFVSICTPFDENSVDLIERLNFDIIKIASCSFTDWPLLEKIVKTNKPIIASTAGVPLEDIDRAVSFFNHREKKFTLMHCVGEYPTLPQNLQLNQIDLLKNRYPEAEIGYSTHESPDNFDSIKMAIAKGASVFEKHVGVKSPEIELNAYSATPEQVKNWLNSAKIAFESCGVIGKRAEFSEKELADLKQFRRGVFAKQMIQSGQKIDLTNVFFAWPSQDSQLLANNMSKYTDYIPQKDINEKDPLMISDLKQSNKREKVYKIVTETRKFLEAAKIALPNKLEIEISHHYGMDDFYNHGAVIITCVNREYCKKLIVLFPGQSHPSHVHKQKEETFQILYGDLAISLDGQEREYKPGEIALVERGIKHDFKTRNGAILEEVSTTHFKNDSFYEDEKISENKDRKTKLTHWLNLD